MNEMIMISKRLSKALSVLFPRSNTLWRMPINLFYVYSCASVNLTAMNITNFDDPIDMAEIVDENLRHACTQYSSYQLPL